MISDPGKTPHVTAIEEYTFAFVASSFPCNKKRKYPQQLMRGLILVVIRVSSSKINCVAFWGALHDLHIRSPTLFYTHPPPPSPPPSPTPTTTTTSEIKFITNVTKFSHGNGCHLVLVYHFNFHVGLVWFFLITNLSVLRLSTLFSEELSFKTEY